MKDPTNDTGTIVSLDALLRLSRRAFCKSAGVGVAVVAIPACFSDSGFERVGVGILDDSDAGTAGPPDDLAATKPGSRPDFAVKGKSNPQSPQDMARSQSPQDFAQSQQQQNSPDLAQPPKMVGNCPGGVFSTGRKPSQFAMNSATYFNGQDTFVCRDNGGLYALSSICTHAGCTNDYRANSNDFHCPCHGADFSLNGDVTRGPAFSGLDHYAVCLDNDGSIAFDTSNTVSQDTRLNA